MIGLGMKEKIRKSFKKVKRDFDKVSKWIKYLNSKVNYHDEAIAKINLFMEENNRVIANKINSLEERIENNEKEKNRILNQIEDLNNSFDEIENLYKVIKTNLNERKRVNQDQFEKLEKILINRFKNVLDRYDKLKDEIKRDKRELTKKQSKLKKQIEKNQKTFLNKHKEIKDKFNKEKKSKKIKREPKKKNSEKKQKHKELKEKITPAEKRIIALLVNTDRPMEYKEIANQLGVSQVTVRRHISSIKKSNFPIKIAKNDLNRNVVILTDKAKKIIKTFD